MSFAILYSDADTLKYLERAMALRLVILIHELLRKTLSKTGHLMSLFLRLCDYDDGWQFLIILGWA